MSGVNLIGEMPSILPANFIRLVLPGNNISGQFPQTVPEINELGILNVADNQLTGDIPGQLLLFPRIQMIDFSQNRFSSINKGKPWSKNVSAGAKSYVSLAGNKNLNIDLTSFMEIFSKINYDRGPLVLNLSNCGIESPLPANVFHFHMTTCDLHKNKFYGEIPDIFWDTSILTYVDISSNSLSGSLPVRIQNLISYNFWIFLEILLCEK